MLSRFSSKNLLARAAHGLPPLKSHVLRAFRFKSSIPFAGSHIESPPKTPFPDKQPIDFTDSQASLSTKTTPQLLRALLVYQLCQFPTLVQNADPLLRMSRKVFGDTLTDSILKSTLYSQFCAGEDEVKIQPVMKDLQANGIGGILDYAAESDVNPEIEKHTYALPGTCYDYESEAACDRHVETFRSCIRSVAKVAPNGFAALKITALGNPQLLERMSRDVVEAEQLFSKFDLDRDGVVSREEFERGYRYYFKDAEERLPELVDRLDPDFTGMVDYITWTKLLTPRDLPRLTASCRDIGPLAKATPTEEELELMDAMFQRAHTLAEEAVQCGTKVLVDAEQARFQPAIDNLVFDLQKKYNSTETAKCPVIFNTYQCYLKETSQDVKTDVERSERFSYHFGAKLVRGAYMESERALAEMLHYPSPIHDTAEDTHACYNESVEYLLRHSVKTDKKLELMCATHNQESIERAIQLMGELGIDDNSKSVHFAQLFGMSDNLTFNLGKHGYCAYKYVPYGEVAEVIPYLMRRAQENSSMLGNASRELELLRAEIWRRIKRPFQRITA
jgi:proline dehydrogenase